MGEVSENWRKANVAAVFVTNLSESVTRRGHRPGEGEKERQKGEVKNKKIKKKRRKKGC